jgi:hypothetical protein
MAQESSSQGYRYAGLIGLGSAIVGGIIYLNTKGTVWGMDLALAVGYSLFVFGMAWVDYNYSYGEESSYYPRPTLQFILIHLTFQLFVIGYGHLDQYARPFMPDWMTHEGRKGSLEYWVFMLPIWGLGIWEKKILLGAHPNEKSPSTEASSTDHDSILKL